MSNRSLGIFFAGLAMAILSACGVTPPEVRLEIYEDDSRPCLGAAHLKIRVELGAGQEKKFDEFGVFFKSEDFSCAIPRQRFDGLPPSKDAKVSLTLHDSSTDASGALSEVQSIPFSISASSANRELIFSLSRKAGARRGTILLFRPQSWGQVGGVEILQFRVIRERDQALARSGYVSSYDAAARPDPFPLVVSNLPTPEVLTEFLVLLEGLNSERQVLTDWSGTAWLGTGINTVAYLTLQ